jgi:hypothetical protein
VRRRGTLRVRVTSDEAATVKLTARVGSTKVATGTAKLSAAGDKQASLALTRAGRRLAKRSRHLRLAISASARDAAGNAGRAQLSKKL